ncbi:hypothetical protein ACVGVM_16085 [Pseudonocardia bannensis]|uniref:Uncharacterized protein n=1 Tax=Pseudonocardia bannensis TaxID=630973 RepID=A0A848DEN9_9PSEU|nr:hypothetical protein [Pseudonocardia bannensis]NMH91033.1 hypothetical protein [Pseudonocardia bannensis]
MEPADLASDQYLLVAEQPLLFHCGGPPADLAGPSAPVRARDQAGCG